MSVTPESLFGREVIYYDDVEITRNNICDVLQKTLTIHRKNAVQIDKLYRIFRGKRAILNKVKTIRPEILNKIVINYPNQIVSFKTSFLLGKPVQYVSRGENKQMLSDDLSREIDILNRYVSDCDKAAKDIELAEWFHICGTSFRMIMSEQDGNDSAEKESPFDFFTLDPRFSFVVYSNEVGHKRLLGVNSVKKADGTIIYNCWTKDALYKVKKPIRGLESIIDEQPHYYGDVPIIEYPANNARLGAFEIVLSLLDAIDAAFSDLADGREQFINSLLVIKGADITDEQFSELRQQGGLKVPADGDVKYLVSELNQTQNGETINLMIDTMLEIVGMPKRSGGSGGTSDNGVAVYLRDGHSDAAARAISTERIFKKSENEFLRIALRICNARRGMQLQLSSVEPHFERFNSDNILSNSQALVTMLESGKIHPELCFESVPIFSDPNSAYRMSAEYEQQRLEQEEKLLADSVNTDHNDTPDGDVE